MLFDNEDDILALARENFKIGNILHFNGNSFNRKIQRCLLDSANLIPDNGHSAQPPDYYSDIYSVMFDVLRINDSEVRKSYNPVKIRERNKYNEVINKIDGMVHHDIKLAVSTESSCISEHTYKNYIKNGQRVICSHIRKIALWKKKHPEIKYKGLFIFDETEVYYEGISIPSGSMNPDKAWLRWVDYNKGLHKPWLDRKLIQQIYESELDFVIWFCPYKPCGIARKIGLDFPYMTIIDTRFHFNDYIEYPDSLVC